MVDDVCDVHCSSGLLGWDLFVHAFERDVLLLLDGRCAVVEEHGEHERPVDSHEEVFFVGEVEFRFGEVEDPEDDRAEDCARVGD